MTKKKHPIEVRASRSAVKLYQSLLKGEWELDTVRETVALLRTLLRSGGVSLSFRWETPSQQPRKIKKVPVPDFASDGFRERLEELNEQADLPEVPQSLPSRRTTANIELAQLSTMCGALLHIQTIMDVRGDDGFLKDVQSLLVGTCIHELLPELQAKGLDDEHDLLVNLIARHLVIVWRNEPGQFFFLQGSLLEYLGNRDHAGTVLEAAFRATPPDAHEYLTRAQAVWSYFIEEGRLRDAEELALRLVRSVRQDDLAEATDLLRDTYGYVHGEASG